MNAEHKRTMSILLAGVLVAVISISGAVYLFGSVIVKNRAVSDTLQSIALEAKREKQLRAVKVLVEDTKEERAVLSNHFIGENDAVLFIEEIERIGALLGISVEITNVTVEELPESESTVADRDFFERVRLSFATEGAFGRVHQLLSLLEMLSTPTRLLQATFQENDDVWRVSASIVALKKKERP